MGRVCAKYSENRVFCRRIPRWPKERLGYSNALERKFTTLAKQWNNNGNFRRINEFERPNNRITIEIVRVEKFARDATHNIPITAPLMQVASVPERIERKPRATISGRRSGTIARIPPIRMPRLPKLAKPHSAYIMMSRDCALSASGGR